MARRCHPGSRRNTPAGSRNEEPRWERSPPALVPPAAAAPRTKRRRKSCPCRYSAWVLYRTHQLAESRPAPRNLAAAHRNSLTFIRIHPLKQWISDGRRATAYELTGTETVSTLLGFVRTKDNGYPSNATSLTPPPDRRWRLVFNIE